MAKTIQEIINEARVFTQDEGTVGDLRDSTDQMLAYLNNGIYEIYRLRPDYFTAYYDTDVPQFTSSQLTDTYPLDGQTTTALAYFIAGNVEAKNDEDVLEGRASGLMALFKTSLMGAS